MCLALRASGLWLRYATMQNLTPSLPWIAPTALHPGAIQWKEGIKSCHLATLRRRGHGMKLSLFSSIPCLLPPEVRHWRKGGAWYNLNCSTYLSLASSLYPSLPYNRLLYKLLCRQWIKVHWFLFNVQFIKGCPSKRLTKFNELDSKHAQLWLGILLLICSPKCEAFEQANERLEHATKANKDNEGCTAPSPHSILTKPRVGKDTHVPIVR